MSRHVSWLLLSWIVLTATSCKAGVDEPCTEQQDCASSLRCHEGTCRDPGRYCREDPRHADRCRREGRCTLVDGQCLPSSKQECEESTRCKEHGYCNFVTTCCSRADFCPHEEEDPITHIYRLGDLARRGAALTKLEELYNTTLSQDGGNRRGSHVGPLLEEIVPPLVGLLDDAELPVPVRAQILRLLASTRHSGAQPALLTALRNHVVDNHSPTPLDRAMSHVLDAVADWRLEAARESVLRLFKTTRVSWKKAQAEGFSGALLRALFALADPAWEGALLELVKRPMDPRGNVNAWLDERHWQRTAARLLGRLRSSSAVEPLLKVVLSPEKIDVAQAAIDALAHIGKPAAEAARALVTGEHPTLTSYVDEHRQTDDPPAADAPPDRPAKAVRVTGGAVVLARIGRADSTDVVLRAIDQADELGRAAIALELSALPPSSEVTQAFKRIYDRSPLDIPVSKQHQGVAALLHAAPSFFDPELTPWLVERAVRLRGSDTELAPYRDTALGAAMRLTTPEQLPEVDRLAELVTPDKYERDYREIKRLLARCREDAACYLDALRTEAPDAREELTAIKAATMVGVYGAADDRSKIAEVLRTVRGPQTRQVLAQALAHLSPEGDAALADKLDQTLGAWALADPVVSGVVARLRARAQP